MAKKKITKIEQIKTLDDLREFRRLVLVPMEIGDEKRKLRLTLADLAYKIRESQTK